VKLGSNCGTVTASRFQPTSASQSGYRKAGRPPRIVAKAGWIASRHEMGEPWAQVAAKRDGIAASVHLQAAAGGREDLEWVWLLRRCCCFDYVYQGG
jgi:hypothetical protein